MLSKKIAKEDLLLLWQFTLNNLEKINIIKNQHQFIEMFLIRSLYLKKILPNKKNNNISDLKKDIKINESILEKKIQPKQDSIDQLKNINQEEKNISTPEAKGQLDTIQIKNLQELVKLCEEKKELKIKYELENNLKLVSFRNQKIEISFSSNLEKPFVKELTAKLLEWTNNRWIIAFSKENGFPTLKDQNKNIKENLLKKESESDFSKKIKKLFSDAELLKVEEDK